MATSDVAASGAAVRPDRARRIFRALTRSWALVAVLGLLFGVPWWTIVLAGQWPTPVLVLGTLAFAGGLVGLPVLMVAGHGRRGSDRAAVAGDTLLGVVWVFFAWSVLGTVLLRLALVFAGVDDPTRSRIVAVSVAAVALVLCLWGYAEAMRVPRVRRVDVVLPRLGAGLDGTRVVLITDTHYGPTDRVRWSERVVRRMNELDADIVCHTGDIADGPVAKRRPQAAYLGDVRARLARTYVTGNHEYFGEANGWLALMGELGWEALHNRHLVVERGGDRLVVAGVDDVTAEGSRLDGHRFDLTTALAGADPVLPVLLLAHQPKMVGVAAERGVDLQLSGHTHGGQIWPFHYLVRVDQPTVQGLTRHGTRTQLYTSRGTGFWGPPLRVFAPSEITVLTLRCSTERAVT